MTTALNPNKKMPLNIAATNGLTTGIGSLPHHNADSALEYAFRFDIPFLPQIPLRNPHEFMLPQALEGLPGLRTGNDGIPRLDLAAWETGRADFLKALQNVASEEWLPTSEALRCWKGFLFEIEERKTSIAKIQIAGPLTCQWSFAREIPELSTAIYRLVINRILGMAAALQERGVQPIVFLDEPGLYGLTLDSSAHRLGLQELKLGIQMLKSRGAWVGLHCCSNTVWESVLQLDVDWLSIDCKLSLVSLLSKTAEVRRFLERGGRLSLGVIPSELPHLKPDLIASDVHGRLAQWLGTVPQVAQKLLREALYTPACGLAFHSIEQTESVFEELKTARKLLIERRPEHQRSSSP
jgi:methionine synthase II (cobalamin-independent)